MSIAATHSAPTNIAVIKYWGKRDAALNLPLNSSLSVTLHQNDMRTITSVVASRDFPRDRLWLNGECVPAHLAIAFANGRAAGVCVAARRAVDSI